VPARAHNVELEGRRMGMRARLLSGAIMVFVAAGAPAARADELLPVRNAAWKFSRGVTNVVTGLPAEVVNHTLGGVTAPYAESVGAGVTGFFSGLFIGTGMGIARVGSGIVDVFTFPVPFNDNRPLLEPEFAL
jgi:putative exosortase-associated protein (TIGR04073 family)